MSSSAFWVEHVVVVLDDAFNLMRFILQTKCAMDAPDSSGNMALHHAGEVQNFLILKMILFTLILLDLIPQRGALQGQAIFSTSCFLLLFLVYW